MKLLATILLAFMPALAFAQTTPPTDARTTTAPSDSTTASPQVSHDDPLWTLTFPTPKEITPPKIVKGTCTSGSPPLKSFDRSKIGVTVIKYHVMPDGSVLGVTVDQTSGADALDESAASCVKQWQYTPATYNGTPVEVTREMKIDWKVRF
jgi:TonB family protein